MLKIALNPDAAYEICTIFAPDCENHQSRHGLNYNSSFNEDYETENEKDSDKDDNSDFLFYGTTNTNVFKSTENSVRINKIK